MRLDVALLPGLIRDTDSVFAVVDVLRASSSIVALLERGAPGAFLAANVGVAPRSCQRCGGTPATCWPSDGSPWPKPRRTPRRR